jgi:hypothetical protein
MITINFILPLGLIHKEERDSLHFSFKTIHPILLEMAVDPNMHPQKPGGRLGGIDL